MAEWTVILDRMERELEDHQTSGHSTVMCPSSTGSRVGYEFMGHRFLRMTAPTVLLSILRLFASRLRNSHERFRRAVEPLGRTRPTSLVRQSLCIRGGQDCANSPKSLRLAGTSVQREQRQEVELVRIGLPDLWRSLRSGSEGANVRLHSEPRRRGLFADNLGRSGCLQAVSSDCGLLAKQSGRRVRIVSINPGRNRRCLQARRRMFAGRYS